MKRLEHRGLAGNFDRGMSAGGRSYGYRTEDTPHGRRLVIDPAEAEEVRGIFEAYADGHSVRVIAHRLNARGVPTARGGSWGVAALAGSSAKGTGLLRNPLYIGRVIWNRRQWIKDPDTGARRYVDRPQHEWQVRQDEALRIVAQPLWDAVQRRASGAAPRGTRAGRGQVPRMLFGGLLRCQDCGGPLVAISATRSGCNIAKDRGATICANRRTVAREQVDRRLLAEVRDQLMSPDALLELQGAVHAQVAALRAEASRSGESVRRRLAAVEGELARLVDAVATIGASQALAERIRASEAERLELVQRLAPPPDLSGLLADVTSRYRRLLLQLEDVLRDEDRERTRAILADLLGQVTVVHEGREVFAELEDPAQRLLLAAAGGSAESLGGVAGGAIRPGDCAGSGWPEGHFSGAPLGQPVGGVLLGDQQIELPAHRLHAALAAFVL